MVSSAIADLLVLFGITSVPWRQCVHDYIFAF